MKGAATISLTLTLLLSIAQSTGAASAAINTMDLPVPTAPKTLSGPIHVTVITGTVDATGAVIDQTGAVVANIKDPTAAKPVDYFAQTLEDRLADLKSSISEAQAARKLTTAQGADLRASLDHVSETAGGQTSHGTRLTFNQMTTLSKEVDAIATAFAATACTTAPSPLLVNTGNSARVAITITPGRKPATFKAPVLAVKVSSPIISMPMEMCPRLDAGPADEVATRQAELSVLIERQRNSGNLTENEARKLRNAVDQVALKLSRYKFDGYKPRHRQALMDELNRLASHINEKNSSKTTKVSAR